MSYNYYRYGYGSDGSLPSESSSIFSYESSDQEGHFSYSDLTPEYEEDSFDQEFGIISIISLTHSRHNLGFKKLRTKDDKDALPVQYKKSGRIGPTFPFDMSSSKYRQDGSIHTSC